MKSVIEKLKIKKRNNWKKVESLKFLLKKKFSMKEQYITPKC